MLCGVAPAGLWLEGSLVLFPMMSEQDSDGELSSTSVMFLELLYKTEQALCWQQQLTVHRLFLLSCSESDSLLPQRLQPTRLLCPQDSPGKNTGVGCHSLLQGIFLTQGWNLDLRHCRQILYHLSLAFTKFRYCLWQPFLTFIVQENLLGCLLEKLAPCSLQDVWIHA